MIDVLFLAKNRLEFTKASFTALVAHTDWSLVDDLWIYDDGSMDGTREWLRSQNNYSRHTHIIDSKLGAPAAIMNDYLNRSDAELFAKIDNDVIVTPGWLTVCSDVMSCCPELDLLGIEPPQSRTPRSPGGLRSKCPEYTARPADMYVSCDSIGGIGLMRRSAFSDRTMTPHSIHGGFTEFQVSHPNIVKGWITPPLNVFLLDRMPTEPWASLSREYIAKGWQRPWSSYDPKVPFWNWWKYDA